ncbi:MarR family winged helix-turn-helix transcriptional regulator [Qipengyuania sp. DSG2-2]|uniref:MarR family winged helix-turn-helix transcriptional regulator n=1 Tax=Qipengyuania sp. DGS2-2 TaxID=3349631 RepID=UPI0036D2F86F
MLGAVGLAVADRIQETARQVMSRAGETPAALVVIGYGTEPSNDQLRAILGLSHPGAVRLVDRLVADGLVERRSGRDRRTLALHLTEKGHLAREELLAGRLAAIKTLVSPLTPSEQDQLGALLSRILTGLPSSDLERCQLCRLCDGRICTDCPIPAEFNAD